MNSSMFFYILEGKIIFNKVFTLSFMIFSPTFSKRIFKVFFHIISPSFDSSSKDW